MLDPFDNEVAQDSSTRLIRLKEVMHRVGLGRSTIYRWMDEGKFPKPLQLGACSEAWLQSDIYDWIDPQISC